MSWLLHFLWKVCIYQLRHNLQLIARRRNLEGIHIYIHPRIRTISLAVQLYRTLRYITWRALGFWNVISVTTDGLLITALIFRILGLTLPDDPRSEQWHYWSFQVLSCVAPLIWYVTYTPMVN